MLQTCCTTRVFAFSELNTELLVIKCTFVTYRNINGCGR